MLQTVCWPAHFDAVPGLPEVLIDYSAIASTDELCRIVRCADVVIAINRNRAVRGSAVVVFGRETLLRLVAEIDPPRPMTVLPFAVDFDTPEVEQLCAGVEIVKGRYEWELVMN